MDSDAAKRAAAAEARRQKILARGAERLNRITVGTPLAATDALVSASSPERPISAAVSDDISAGDANSAPPAGTAVSSSGREPGSVLKGLTEAAAVVEEPSARPDSAFAAADPLLQQVLRGGGGHQPEPDATALHAAHREAEQALHMLLNQLAGPAGTDLMAQRQPGGGTSSSGRTAGDGDGGGGVAGEGRRAVAAAASAAGSGRRAAATPSTAAGAAGAAGAADGSGGSGGVLVALVASVAARAGLLLGTRLTAAVEATRRLRCAAAIALAAVLYGGVLEPAHLGLPPVLALLVLQVAVIVAARLLLTPPGGGRSVAAGFSKSASGGDLASSGDGAGVDDGTEASAAKNPPPSPSRFDWATFVPGLRPLLDRLSSAGALVSGLFGDVSLYLVSYMVLDAWSKVAGHRRIE